MNRTFHFSFQHKVIIVFLVIMNLSFLLTGYLAKNVTESMILQEKENKLLSIARILDASLPPMGFDGLLHQYHAEGASREEKIRVLSRALRKATDEVGESAPGLGVGFYSRDLDAIITYGPTISFGKNVGVTIPPDHPGREVMEKNKPTVRFGTMVRGDILNAMIPIQRSGKVIGYIWANELTTDVASQMDMMKRNIFLGMILCSALIFILVIVLSRRTLRDMGRIIEGVRAMKQDLSRRIESSQGDLGEVVDSINDMAAEIGKATEETNRAVSVLQSVMGNVDAMIYVCDPQTKEIVYANVRLCNLLKRDDLEGKTCHEVLYGNTSACSFCPQNKLFDEEGNPVAGSFSSEIHNKLIDRDFLATDRLITWHDGRLLHLEVGTDVTEQNALAVSEAANLAQREFLARISNEIRTPMNSILGIAHMAIEAAPSPAQTEYLEKILRSTNELLWIVNDMVDYSRIGAGSLVIEKQAFNVREMTENIKETIFPRANEKRLDFCMTVDESVPEYVVGDSLRLSQVLLNLLSNALKFTVNGSISLDLQVKPLSMGLLGLYCRVGDTGTGMSKEQLEVLFDPFSYSDNTAFRRLTGSGLGLAICKALVELMGGRISVESQAGAGSEFSFYVACAPLYGSPGIFDEQAGQWRDARYDGEKILVVGDNAIYQEMTKGILSSFGAEVDIVSNGVDAVKAFLEKDYSMILMDVRMPVMDGLETTRRIRGSAKHDATSVPIVAITTHATLEDRLASREAGMDAHIAKPINMDELKGTLYQQIRLRLWQVNES